MTQTEFINAFIDNLDEEAGWELTKKDAKTICEILGMTVEELLNRKPPAEKNAVAVVPGLGRFTLVKRPRRKGRNPATGESIMIKASKKVRVTVAKPIRDALGSK